MRTRTEHMVSQLVELLLPRNSGHTVGLYVPIVASGMTEDFEWEHTDVGLLFARPYNYTAVWAAYGDRLVWLPAAEDFEFVAYHDSCWRDGVSEALWRAETTLRECGVTAVDDASIGLSGVRQVTLSYEGTAYEKKLLTLSER